MFVVLLYFLIFKIFIIEIKIFPKIRRSGPIFIDFKLVGGNLFILNSQVPHFSQGVFKNCLLIKILL